MKSTCTLMFLAVFLSAHAALADGQEPTRDFAWPEGTDTVCIEKAYKECVTKKKTPPAVRPSTPPGVAGSQGPKGRQGPKGDTGPAGPQGLKGTPGEQGEPGRDGLRGSDGSDGPQGPRGIPGEKGEKGEPGGSLGLKIGPHAGFLLLNSIDGTRYTGASIGVRLSLVLNSSTSINIDGNMLAANDIDPFGSSVRGGLSKGLTEWLKLEVGVGTAWVGYNNRLKAKSNFTTGDVGLTLNPFWKVEVGANLLLGVEFDQERPAFAYGCLLSLRLPLP